MLSMNVVFGALWFHYFRCAEFFQNLFIYQKFFNLLDSFILGMKCDKYEKLTISVSMRDQHAPNTLWIRFMSNVFFLSLSTEQS